MAGNLLAMLQGTGLPVTYLEWPYGSAPDPPYVVYLAEDSRNFAADNVVYHPLTNYLIELYTDYKNPATEALIEAALTAAGIYYSKLETHIETENLYQVSYLVQI